MIDLTTPNARRAEVLGAGALILIILGLSLWYMATHQAPEPYLNEPAPAPTSEMPAPTVFEEHGEYYDIHATYPAETALAASAGAEADSRAVRLMEDFIEDTVRDFKRQGRFESLTPAEAAFIGLTDGRKESLVVAYEESASPRTVSYIFTIFLDTLGAHPNTFYRTFTFDTVSGEELRIDSLFAPRADYLTRLSAIAEFELVRSLNDFADIDYIRQGITPNAINFQSFALDGERLILIFPPYQVAPYAAGTQQVSIPLTQLAEILKPDYRP